MKSQDILLLLKLVSLSQRDRPGEHYLASKWQDWEDRENYDPPSLEYALRSDEYTTVHLRSVATHEHSSVAQYSVRALAEMTGISKSQVALSLTRCYEVGLARPDRLIEIPKVNVPALGEFVVYGLKYVFPAKLGAMTRGIATAWAAPVLGQSLESGGELPPVWPDAHGSTKGQMVEPLYKTVPVAVRKDAALYALLALVDAIRIGLAREKTIAADKFIALLEKGRE